MAKLLRQHIRSRQLLFWSGDAPVQSPTPPDNPSFQIICINCDGIGIFFECVENAPAQTIIKCGLCDAPRGTLGQLRRLSSSGKLAVFGL
jgi:hypothetical protein